MSKIKIGDIVKIVDEWDIYESYTLMAHEMNLDNFSCGKKPREDCVMEVVAIKNHPQSGIELLGLADEESSFIVDLENVLLVSSKDVGLYPSGLIKTFVTKTNGIVSFEKDAITIIQEDFTEYKCLTMERAEDVMQALLVLHEGE